MSLRSKEYITCNLKICFISCRLRLSGRRERGRNGCKQ
nr:MAG TPA: hypothetical protein [Bacteriophage sp.]